MGLFNMFSKEPNQPYKDSGLNSIYNLLFCDNIDLYKKSTQPTVYPWDVLLASKPAIDSLKEIVANKKLESRQRMLAYNLLTSMGHKEQQKELLGVIIEVVLENGLDVVAAFSDGSARYINHSEKLLVWDTETTESDAWIHQLFADSIKVVNQIGAWDGARKPFPGHGMVRLTFLVSDGLYFGEGPFDVLQKDAMGGPVIESATGLMLYLTQHTLEKNKTV